MMLGALVLGLALAVVIGALFAAVMTFLWNAAIATTFGLPTVGFWVMWGIIVFVGFCLRMLQGK